MRQKMKFLALLTSALLGFAQGQNDVTFTGFVSSVDNYVVGLDVYGDIMVSCWHGRTGSISPGNLKTELRIYQMTQAGTSSLLTTIADPTNSDYSQNNAGKFCLGVQMDEQYIYVPAPSEKKIYIYDYSNPAVPVLDHTWDGSGITVNTFWPNVEYLGRYNAMAVDKEGGSNTVMACGDSTHCSAKTKRSGSWTGGANTQIVTGLLSASNYGPIGSLAISHGGGFYVGCQKNSNNNNAGCAFGKITASGGFSSATQQRNNGQWGSSPPKGLAIRANDADSVNNNPYYWMMGLSGKVESHNWAQMNGASSRGFSETCSALFGGQMDLRMDSELNQLLVSQATNSPLEDNGRCILDVSSTNKNTYSILYQYDADELPFVSPETGYASSFAGQSFGFQGNSLLVSTGYSSDDNKKQGIYTAYNNVDPPPTPSPTLSPTKSPTFECYSSSTCGDNEYCAGATQTCEQTACGSHFACDGLFMSGRLTRCGESGFCEDVFEGTCTNAVDCENKNSLKEAARDSVGVLTQQLTLTNITLAREVIGDLKAAASNTAINQNVTFKITGTEKVYLEQALFDQVGNDQAILDAVATVLCGVTGKDAASVSQVNGPSARRALQSAGEIEVTVTYEVEDTVYDSFPAGSFDAPGFVTALEAALSLGAGNVTVTDVEGVISITYVVTNEATGDDPLSEENFDELNDLAAELATIESTIQTQFGLNEADLSTAVIDKCGDRDCNGRGTCNPDTGVCLCDSTDYWGVNCETDVLCAPGQNVPKNGVAYCECPYPASGQRCQTPNACTGCV